MKNLTLAIPSWATMLNCTPSTPALGPWIIAPYKQLVCFAEYSFSQDFYEAGLLSFTAEAKPNELALVTSAPATVQPTYSATMAFHEGACTLPVVACE
jgi:hypothetical protein